MRRLSRLVTALVLGAAGCVLIAPGSVPAAGPPTHTLTVTGTGVAMYPAFDRSIDRYGVTTTAESGGTLTIIASTSEDDGEVRVDGRPVASGTATLTGLEDGDEIAVWITDSAGTERHTLVYLPVGFPAVDVTVDEPGNSPGGVFLTLSQWGQPTPKFETVVDRQGVPTHVDEAAGMDFKMLPNGHFTSSRQVASPRTGQGLVELDQRFQEVRSQESVGGLNDTDGHDSIVLDDGSVYLLSYDHKPGTGLTDAVIQQIGPDGEERWRWDSGDFGPDHESLAAETVNSATFGIYPGDYAHINSIWLMSDGNILASFRHLSAVLKIARHPTDGFQEGEVIWKLGGVDSSFDFPAGDGGPCAQHSASELENGHILIYDNGSDPTFSGKMCIDPDDPTGPPIARPQTRVTEWALTEPAGGRPGTADLVWNLPTYYGFFAGNAQRLAGGNTMIGWAASPDAVAMEVDPQQRTVWKLTIPKSDNGYGYTTYRAFKFEVPDAIPPAIQVLGPAAGATYVEGARVVADFTCTDRGGSGLATCGGSLRSGDQLDTRAPGTRSYTIRATDGAGQVTRTIRRYVVAPAAQPDALVRRLPAGSWRGSDRFGAATGQTLRSSLTRTVRVVRSAVRLQNDGARRDTLGVRATGGNRTFAVRYLDGRDDVTRRVVAGTWRTVALQPGRSARLTVVVTRLRPARPGDARTFVVRTTSHADPTRRDAVALAVTAKGRGV